MSAGNRYRPLGVLPMSHSIISSVRLQEGNGAIKGKRAGKQPNKWGACIASEFLEKTLGRNFLPGVFFCRSTFYFFASGGTLLEQ